MTTRYRLSSNEHIHAPGVVEYFRHMHNEVPRDVERSWSARRQQVYKNNKYEAVYLMGSSFPTMQFGHVVAVIEGKAKLTTEGETLIVEIEE